MNPQQLINACESTIKLQMVEIDKLRAEIKQLVEWIDGDRDALTCLQFVYNNPNASDANRVKAAAAAIGFERPKMTVSVRVGPAVLGDRLDQAKLVNPPLIEHDGSLGLSGNIRTRPVSILILLTKSGKSPD